MKHKLNPVMDAQLNKTRQRQRGHRRNMSDGRISSATEYMGEDVSAKLTKHYLIYLFIFVNRFFLLHEYKDQAFLSYLNYSVIYSLKSILSSFSLKHLKSTYSDSTVPPDWRLLLVTWPALLLYVGGVYRGAGPPLYRPPGAGQQSELSGLWGAGWRGLARHCHSGGLRLRGEQSREIFGKSQVCECKSV